MSAPPPPPSRGPTALPPPPVPGGPAMPKGGAKKKWAPVVAEQTLSKWSVDPSWQLNRSLPSIDINASIDWLSTKGVSAAEDGSGGVFFVELGSGIVVLKSSLTIASDIFASRLAGKLNIHTPATRLMYYLKSDEWDPMVLKLWDLEQTNSIAGRGSKLAKCLNRPFLLLSEFMPGPDLANMPKEKASSIVGSAAVLREIGKLISFDLLLNQWDRFPCGAVWDNEGNPKNVIFTPVNSHYLVNAIDNNMTSIDPSTHATNFENYKNKVVGTITDIFGSGDRACAATKPVRDFILMHTAFDIGNEGQVEIQKGIKEGVKAIVALPIVEFAELKSNIDKQVRETLSLLGVDDDHIGFSRINVGYLESMHGALAKCIEGK